MSRSLNKATLIGNAGSDPEVRTTATGARVATVTLATNRRWTDADGVHRERTEWHRLVALDELAQVFERNVRKGTRLCVAGHLEYRSWDSPRGRRQQFGKEQAEAKLARQVPLGRIGHPDDIANAVLYLASDESRFMTGAELKLDGGISAM